MTIKQLCEASHQQAVRKGFWEDDRNDGELLMLIVSELSEALEALRDCNPKSSKIKRFTLLEEELADAVIRICDMADARGCRLEEALSAKLKYNEKRPRKHGKAF